MAVPGSSLTLSLLFFLLIVSSYSPIVESYYAYESLNKSRPVCYIHRESSSQTSLVIRQRHGPCSPFTSKKGLYIHEILRRDVLRVKYLQYKSFNGSSSAQLQDSLANLPATRGDAFGSSEYIVTLGLGTPKLDQTVLFDTGSDISWVQCLPCAMCYNQKEQKYDPSTSSTYNNIPCNAPECNLFPEHGCSTSGCAYKVGYGDGSSTTGQLVRDTLTLSASDLIPGFIFGCGQNNQGFPGESAGLLGLGRSELSIVSQTSEKYGEVFSYCLPNTASSTGSLNFGPPAASSVLYTPMLTDPSRSSFYFVNLQAISVEGQQLSITPGVFSSTGTILDSGTVISRLPPSAYDALKSAFKSGMNYPPAQASGILDTCYDLSGYQEVSIPSIALHFEGVTLELDGSGILFHGCLAFTAAEEGSIGIIGNTQQRTTEVVYDLGAERIGFIPGACS